MEGKETINEQSLSRDYLTKTTMQYGSRKVYKRFLLLTIVGTVWSYIMSMPLLFGLVDLGLPEETNAFPFQLILFTILVMVTIPVIGFIRIYYASKSKDQEKMYNALGILNIYLQVVIALLFLIIAGVGVLAVFALLLGRSSTAIFLFLPVVVVLFCLWYLYYAYLKTALHVVSDLMDLVDLEAKIKKTRYPNFKKFNIFNAVFLAFAILGSFFNLLGIGSVDTTTITILSINGFPLGEIVSQLLGIAVLAYTVHMISDIDQEFQQAYVND